MALTHYFPEAVNLRIGKNKKRPDRDWSKPLGEIAEDSENLLDEIELKIRELASEQPDVFQLAGYGWFVSTWMKVRHPSMSDERILEWMTDNPRIFKEFGQQPIDIFANGEVEAVKAIGHAGVNAFLFTPEFYD